MDLEPLDTAFVQERLSQPPFLAVDGVYNFRDLSYTATVPIKPGFIFRSGELSGVTDEGKARISALGIRKVFDMRSDPEMQKYEAPLPTIEGVDVIRTPVFKSTDYSPEMMAKRYKLYASGKTEAFMQLYSQILDHGGPAFSTVLRHIKDRPSEPFVFHCTAGKDRTGVLAALILKLADVPDEAVAEDYALTRVGREPARAMVMARLAKEPMFATDKEAMLNMFTCRHETMIAFLALLEEKYGGVEEYLSGIVGLSQDEISVVRKNIVAV